jgi:hypothetical protein
MKYLVQDAQTEEYYTGVEDDDEEAFSPDVHRAAEFLDERDALDVVEKAPPGNQLIVLRVHDG